MTDKSPTYILRTLLFAAMCIFCVSNSEARKPQIGIKSNLLYDAALLPNVGVEVPWGRGFSTGLNFDYMWIRDYRRSRHWRIEGGDLYLRKWFGSVEPLTGHHIGVYGQMYTFQIQLNDRHGFLSGKPGQNLSRRPGWGVGLEYGYSKPISKHLNLDFSFGAGYFGATVQQYHPERPVVELSGGRYRYVWEKTHRLRWFGPTKLEIALVWRL